MSPSPKPAICCKHRVNQHSSTVGCMECRCRYRLADDGQLTFDPFGKYAKDHAAPDDQAVMDIFTDAEVAKAEKFCPECEKPNQFGEMCAGCEIEFNRCERAAERFNREHGLYEYGEASEVA